jgi:hypothetical protein
MSVRSTRDCALRWGLSDGMRPFAGDHCPYRRVKLLLKLISRLTSSYLE